MIIHHSHNGREAGQGLVEYSLILVLVSVVSMVILSVLGPQINDVFCSTITQLDTISEPPEACNYDMVVITKAEHKASAGQIKIRATSDGGFNTEAVLTATVNGQSLTMTGDTSKNYYEAIFNSVSVSGCPCVVTVTSTRKGTRSAATESK